MLAVLALWMPLELHAQTEDMPGRHPPTTEVLRNYASFLWMSATPIDTSIFQRQNLNLREALGLLMEEMAAKQLEFPILVDTESFRELKPRVDIYKVPVRIPRFPRKQAAGKILRNILAQATEHEAAFFVRYCYIEITPKQRITPNTWLSQFTNPNGRPLIGAKQKRVE